MRASAARVGPNSRVLTARLQRWPGQGEPGQHDSLGRDDGAFAARSSACVSHALTCALNSQLRHMRWNEAADLVIRGLEGAITARTVTYDFHRQARAMTQARALSSLQPDALAAWLTDGAGG